MLSKMYGYLVKMRYHSETPSHWATDNAIIRPVVQTSGFRNACIATQRIAIIECYLLPFDVNLTSLQIALNAARRPTYLLTPAPPAAAGHRFSVIVLPSACCCLQLRRKLNTFITSCDSHCILEKLRVRHSRPCISHPQTIQAKPEPLSVNTLQAV